MATRNALRFVSHRFSSSGGKVLSEEEKTAENVYIKKMEQEKLEKIARKGPNPGEQSAAGGGASAAEAKASAAASASEGSTPKVSDGKYDIISVSACFVAFMGSLGWYMKSELKKKQEAQD